MAKVHPLLDAARLLHDLQRVNAIAQSLSGNLDAEGLAYQVTEALVSQFGCAFARIWLVEPDQTTLRLVSSSGLYTHVDGSFARVPVGAYKVGKIAQNRVPFLSNQLPEESWVKDRQWALDNRIQGFAGYPLVANERILGVIAAFSHHPFAPEFLEVLQVLCMTLTVALDAALQATGMAKPKPSVTGGSLCDQLAGILGDTHLTLVGRERALTVALTYSFLRTAELLKQLGCGYCRLSYGPLQVALEAIVSGRPELEAPQPLRSHFDHLKFLAACLGGTLQSQPGMGGQAYQVSLELPYAVLSPEFSVRIQCHQAVLQQAFTHLAYQAGLVVCGPGSPEAAAVQITDNAAAADVATLWIRQGSRPVPDQVSAVVDLATTPEQLRQRVQEIVTGDWVAPASASPSQLSSREQQVMRLLAEGKRDRNIAQELYISESTVKFHINNSLTKLNAKNRYQGVYQAAIRGWI